MYRADTIVACATPPGRGAIAIVRLSGGDAFTLAERMLRPRYAGTMDAWKLTRCLVLPGPGGDAIDDVLAVRMPAPRTYTGEDTVEIHCHGSPLVVEAVIGSAVAGGARLAEPGEFSRRAVLNGRMDLLQVEAVADLIDARVSAGARAAWQQLQGALSEHLAELRGAIVGVLAEVEANVDFSDEELPAENIATRIATLAAVESDIVSMLDGFAASQRSREGHVVVFAGRPNVGKSSLLNSLLGRDRMIIADLPGTTRDTVEEVVDLGGHALVLTDTAGVHAAANPADIAAVARADDSRREADIVVLVIDGSACLGDDDRRLLDETAGAQRIVVVNKIDLAVGLSEQDEEYLGECSSSVTRLSAKTGQGCDALKQALVAMAQAETAECSQTVTISRLRHHSALEAARKTLRRAVVLLERDGPAELVAAELRATLDAMASITDAVGNEEILDRIFADFCIGK